MVNGDEAGLWSVCLPWGYTPALRLTFFCGRLSSPWSSLLHGQVWENGGEIVGNKPRKEKQNTLSSKKNNKRRKGGLLVKF